MQVDSNAIIRLNNNIEAVNPSDNSFEIMEDVKTSNSTFEMKETVNPGNISLGDVKNRHLYVMLSMTGTPLSRAIRFSTKEPYSHCSISLDRELHEMYSFGRLIKWTMIFAGLVHEVPDRNVYRLYEHTLCAIYEVDVTEEQYKEAKEYLKRLWNRRKYLSYNTPGLVLARFNRYPAIPNSYYCSQFVGLVLQHIGVNFTEKSYRAVRPNDFRNNPNLKLVCEGELRDYWNMYCISDGFTPY